MDSNKPNVGTMGHIDHTMVTTSSREVAVTFANSFGGEPEDYLETEVKPESPELPVRDEQHIYMNRHERRRMKALMRKK